MAKYKKGTPASEEHRYADAASCHAAAQAFYNSDYLPPHGGPLNEPPLIESPDPTNPAKTIIYSWRKPATDLEMRFIVKAGLPKYPENITYYRIERSPKGFYNGDEDDLNEAINSNELGAGSDQTQTERAKQDITPVNGKYVWRAIVREAKDEVAGENLAPGDPTGYTTNPPYPP